MTIAHPFMSFRRRVSRMTNAHIVLPIMDMTTTAVATLATPIDLFVDTANIAYLDSGHQLYVVRDT